MNLLDRINNPKKYKGTSKKKPPLETDFSNGEESDAWFIAWKVYDPVFPLHTTHNLREFGSEIFAFPKKMSPKDILQHVKICLKFHLNPGSADLPKITDAEIAANPIAALLHETQESQREQADPNIHITQFNKL
ncbi:hypothetical protein [Atlantibacter hermannii]|uniref:hypothetical protein n=1 Tax=Atlantibacter hermannii TaxID=565 RepID=UPI0019326890|nr:hypothetical protein [Atlantibacter hermannii]MBL7635156.1 hypothetical protein [Atlantibacter hermannii]MBL7675903.1 hypothetical protein [Atlantibacter hermannii]